MVPIPLHLALALVSRWVGSKPGPVLVTSVPSQSVVHHLALLFPVGSRGAFLAVERRSLVWEAVVAVSGGSEVPGTESSIWGSSGGRVPGASGLVALPSQNLTCSCSDLLILAVRACLSSWDSGCTLLAPRLDVLGP